VILGIEPVGVALSESISCRRIVGMAVASGTMMPSTRATSTPTSLVASGVSAATPISGQRKPCQVRPGKVAELRPNPTAVRSRNARRFTVRTRGYTPPGASNPALSNWRVRIIISAAKMPAHAATGTASVVARSRTIPTASAPTRTSPAAIPPTSRAATIAPAKRGIFRPRALSANPPE
jgi:hypothetical protein